MTSDPDIPDTIERQIDIDASAETVWELISEPGWWINEGTIVAHEVRDAGDHVVVSDPTYGDFRLRVLDAAPPRRIRYAWLDDEHGDTSVEFVVADRSSGVTLRVTERGLASSTAGLQRRREHDEQNFDGWGEELRAARQWCTSR